MDEKSFSNLVELLEQYDQKIDQHDIILADNLQRLLPLLKHFIMMFESNVEIKAKREDLDERLQKIAEENDYEYDEEKVEENV